MPFQGGAMGKRKQLGRESAHWNANEVFVRVLQLFWKHKISEKIAAFVLSSLPCLSLQCYRALIMRIRKNFREEIIILKMHTSSEDSKIKCKSSQKSKLMLVQKWLFFPMGPWVVGCRHSPAPSLVRREAGGRSAGLVDHLTLVLSLHISQPAWWLLPLLKKQGHSSSATW